MFAELNLKLLSKKWLGIAGELYTMDNVKEKFTLTFIQNEQFLVVLFQIHYNTNLYSDIVDPGRWRTIFFQMDFKC